MSDERRFLICTPASSGPPVAPSIPDRCHACGQAVWVSNRNAHHIVLCNVTCLDCARERMKQSREVIPIIPEGTMADLVALGWPEDFVKAVLHHVVFDLAKPEGTPTGGGRRKPSA